MIISSLRRASLASLLIASLASFAPSSQAQVSVDVNVTLDGIVILDYYNQVNISIPSAALFSLGSDCAVSGGVTQCSQGSVNATAALENGELVVAASPVPLTPTDGVPLTAVPLLLENVWAVRAIATATQQVNVQVAIPGGSSTLNNAGASMVLSLGTGINPVSFTPPGLVAPRWGDVSLQLDLSQATLAGQYSSTSGTDYTLTATLN